MGKFDGAKKFGLKSKKDNKIVAIYPDEVKGSDEEIEKTVKDWYYTQGCSAEDELLSMVVVGLTEEGLK